MLLYLFITLLAGHAVSYQISCYECPLEANTLDYLLTTERTPEKLSNCSLRTVMTECTATMIWQQHPNRTKIVTSGTNVIQSTPEEHLLNVAVGLQNKQSVLAWEKIVSYRCSSNECNSFEQIKRLLASLTVTDQLTELQQIITPREPFAGQWCDRVSNATFDDCDTSIPVASCQQCSLRGQSDPTRTEMCATCFPDSTGNNFVSRSAAINMTTGTWVDNWQIQCAAENCNSLRNGEWIRQTSDIRFNFANFFNRGHSLASRRPAGAMVFIFVVLTVERLF